MKNSNPKARRDDLLIETLPTELLVYDKKNHRAHCLNASAASVFQNADGSRSVGEIADAAGQKLGAAFSEDLTWLALQELEKNDLLETPLPLAPLGQSRRNLLIGAGTAAAVLLPLVLVVTAPTPAYAQSGSSVPASGGIPPASTASGG